MRDARFSWVTSHVVRKTRATILDEAGLSARRSRASSDTRSHP